MKNINEQFEEIEFVDSDFSPIDNKLLIKAILFAGGGALLALLALFGFLYLVFTLIF